LTSRLLIPVLALGLVSCASTKTQLSQVLNPKDSLTITESQFDCSPVPNKFPQGDALNTTTSANAFDYTTDYWFWGERCSLQLKFNRDYFYCWKGDKLSCDSLNKDKAKLNKAQSTQTQSTPPTQVKP
jgi:hypothetical protein